MYSSQSPHEATPVVADRSQGLRHRSLSQPSGVRGPARAAEARRSREAEKQKIGLDLLGGTIFG